ncbi:acyl-CoA thioesterase-1 [Microbulbifer donghaiensis]|uniref:Acyl-CoA thioesterase-1 n=1 Tax=Microbulbifer donghaiensis TaxID=494016 RepID=A0A1M5FZA0_9GAMM|nr:arylesterase [Microbulbifer donghaiensis]SHF96796.1 acyl-CoA thioesterase-1 [Microbulbifer donghaiensis]
MTTVFFRQLLARFGLLLLLSVPQGQLQASAADTLLVLGDSISAAYGIDEAQGWVQLLRDRLEEGDRPVNVVNASISGETTAGGLARLPRLLQEHRPRWLIVELGGNDGLRGYPPRSLQSNLQQMVQLAEKQGAEVLLLGMRMPPNYGRAYTEAFAAVYPKVAKAEQVPLVPFFLEPVALLDGAMQTDGIHPTAKAQPALLDHVWPCVQVLLDERVDDQSCTP